MKPEPAERWLLVTSAYHLPRAVACYRAAGWDVIAYAADYRRQKSPLRIILKIPREGPRVLDGLVVSTDTTGGTLRDEGVRFERREPWGKAVH